MPQHLKISGMRNLYMICFDVSDERRLRKISKELCNFCARLQHSVMERYLDENLESNKFL
jgi:CRISPR-associated endonuclease Cas2